MTVYTDNAGRYSFNIGPNEPDQLTIRLYFSNEYVNVQSLGGTRSDFETLFPAWTPCFPEPQLPSCFELGKNEIIDINYINQPEDGGETFVASGKMVLMK